MIRQRLPIRIHKLQPRPNALPQVLTVIQLPHRGIDLTSLLELLEAQILYYCVNRKTLVIMPYFIFQDRQQPVNVLNPKVRLRL